MREIFISIDIEADGDNIYKHNCIQVGMVACYFEEKPSIKNIDLWLVSKFQVSIENLENHYPDERTMSEFWNKNMLIYRKIKENAIPPEVAVQKISSWLEVLSSLYHIKCFVARPASYDWLWFSQLYQHFDFPRKYSLPYSITCIKSLEYALELIGIDYKKNVQNAKLPHTHDAIDDALSQAYRFLRLRSLLKKVPEMKNIIKINFNKN